jgi:hypothetical protein
VLDGGRIVWAVADIVAPFLDRPLEFRQPANGPIENANRVESFRNATISSSKLWNRFSPFKPLIVTQQEIAAFKSLAVI